MDNIIAQIITVTEFLVTLPPNSYEHAVLDCWRVTLYHSLEQAMNQINPPAAPTFKLHT